MNELELHETRRYVAQSSGEVLVGLVSIALTFPLRHSSVGWTAGLPGFAYMLLSVALPVLHARFDRGARALGAPAR